MGKRVSSSHLSTRYIDVLTQASHGLSIQRYRQGLPLSLGFKALEALTLFKKAGIVRDDVRRYIDIWNSSELYQINPEMQGIWIL